MFTWDFVESGESIFHYNKDYNIKESVRVYSMVKVYSIITRIIRKKGMNINYCKKQDCD